MLWALPSLLSAEIPKSLRIVTFDDRGDVSYLAHNAGNKGTLLYQEAADPAARDTPFDEFLADTGEAQFVTKETSAKARLWFDVRVPANTRVRLGAIGAGNKGYMLWRYFLGTPSNIKEFASGRGISSAQAKDRDFEFAGMLAHEVKTGDRPQVIRFTLLGNSSPGRQDIQAIFAENLDGGPAPVIIDQNSQSGIKIGKPATYYVAPESGDNDHDGLSTKTPFKTVPRGLVAGTTIHFKGGERLRQRIEIGAKGTREHPIVLDFNSEGSWGEGPGIIDGGTIIKDWTDHGDGTFSAPWPKNKAPKSLVLYQDNRRLAIAQLPVPSDFQAPSTVSDLATAEAMTPTTVTAPEFFKAFKQAPDLPGTMIRVWEQANSVRVYPITDYDPQTGTVTFKTPAGNPFIPYTQPRRWKFAVFNHPDCIVAPGMFYRSADGKRLVIRPFDNADPREAIIDYPGGLGTPIAVTGSYTEIRGPLIEKVSASRGIFLDKAYYCTVSDAEIRNSSFRYALHVAGGQYNLVRDSYVHDTTRGRGIFFSGTKNSVMLRNRAERTEGTATSFYGTLDCIAIGNVIPGPKGVHSNGMSCYLGNQNLTLLFNTFYSAFGGKPLTLQNFESGSTFAFNTFVTNTRGGYIFTHWMPSNNGWKEIGRHWIANNVVLSQSETAFGLFPQKGINQSEVTIVNNITDGIQYGRDKRFNDALFIKEYEVVSPGQGYKRGQRVYAQGGVPNGKPSELKVERVPIRSAKDLKLRRHRTYDPGNLPEDMSRVEYLPDPPGDASGLILSVKAFPAVPALRTRNMVTRFRKGQVPPGELAELGDIDARAFRDKMFTDITDEDRTKWDLTPSGEIDVSDGYEWTLEIDNPRLPGFPAEGIKINHIGRYKPDGSEVWDWSAAGR